MRGFDTARLVNARPSTVVFTRDTGDGDFALPPQTLRLEVVQNIRGNVEIRDAMIASTKQYVVIVGYKDNPLAPDTNILRADRFFYQEREYEVIEIIDTVPGRLLATANLTP